MGGSDDFLSFFNKIFSFFLFKFFGSIFCFFDDGKFGEINFLFLTFFICVRSSKIVPSSKNSLFFDCVVCVERIWFFIEISSFISIEISLFISIEISSSISIEISSSISIEISSSKLTILLLLFIHLN